MASFKIDDVLIKGIRKYIDVSKRSVKELISLSGCTDVVTVGAIGISRANALPLAEAGANVVIGELNAEQAQQMAEELTFLGGKHLASRLDVNDHASGHKKVVDETCRLDIWMNNAGI